MSTKTDAELTFGGSGDEFISLEERIYRTIELLKSAREGKLAAEQELAKLRVSAANRDQEVDALKAEILTLRKEREEVRSRVEKMLARMDALIEEERA